MNWMIYLKTTETCNLNCKHCFTSGISGRRIFMDVNNTVSWISRMVSEQFSEQDHIHIEFHGGEPFLAPIADINRVYNLCKSLHPSISWGATSNLTFKLTDDIVDTIKGPLNNRIGTSWDPNIRFSNEKQRMLWENNVRKLLRDGVQVKLFISVTKDTIDIDPIELLLWVRDLGIQELSFERLTSNGNALLHPEIFPTNKEQDAWFLLMHHRMVEHNAREWFDNEFMEIIYNKFEHNFIKGGTFCRDCEEKIFTINADGTISGCPNAAPEFNYGHITDSTADTIANPKRIEAIACERGRNVACFECPVFQYCGGDCHQLEWQDGVCGAPKSLMKHLAGINTSTHKIFLLKEV